MSYKELKKMQRKEEIIRELEVLCVREAQNSVYSPEDVVEIMTDRIFATVEYFDILLIDSKNHIIKRVNISKGTAGKTLVHPRDVFRAAVFYNAVGIIAVHNHPSGNVEPSEEDRKLTKCLQDAGELLGIPLLDHIIVGSGCKYHSVVHNSQKIAVCCS